MSVRKSSHGTIFLIVSSGSPRALIASSLRSTSKKPFCPMTRSLHPPMTACGHRVRFVATWREEFFEVPTNLIKDFLCTYTETFAKENLKPDQVRVIGINNALFNYETESWVSTQYTLPWTGRDYVILSPKDLLTRDENWINKHDLLRRFEEIPPAISDDQLRGLVSNYFERMLPRYQKKEPSAKEYAEAARQTILQFPDLIDYYIRSKEDRGDQATSIASEKVRLTEQLLIKQLKELQRLLAQNTSFYS